MPVKSYYLPRITEFNHRLQLSLVLATACEGACALA